MIKEVVSKYTQKSRIFLFPLLGFPRISVTNPAQTYTSWKDKYDHDDMHLICEYPNRNDADFKTFETKKLLAHPCFVDYHESENNTGIYVFNLSNYKDTWNAVTNGKYSQILVTDKLKIRKYFSNNTSSLEHIESYLYPEKYFNVYSKLLNVEESLLISVGELCSKPDVTKETLDVKIKHIQLF